MTRSIADFFHRSMNLVEITIAARELGFIGELNEFNTNDFDRFLKTKGWCLSRGYALKNPSEDRFALCRWGLSESEALELARGAGFATAAHSSPGDHELNEFLKKNHNFHFVEDQGSGTFFTNLWQF